MTPDINPHEDDWSDFGGDVIRTQLALLKGMISTLDQADWNQAIEPLYATFRKKVIACTRAYHNPWIVTTRDGRDPDAPLDPHVVVVIGFASDDAHEITVSLEQMFFECFWRAGEEAFNEIPEIWKRAKARLDAGEPEADNTGYAAARL